MKNCIENMADWRNIANGLEIPTVSYCDQPYLIKTDDGAWLCCVTTGQGHEGEAGQHVTTMRSIDFGKSWSKPVSIEPGCDVENSYASMLKVPSGRVYIFYNHNTDNVRSVKRHDGLGVFPRVDSLGYFVFKFSDDNGLSWSERRYNIPVRMFKCDYENIYKGEICFFWNVGKPFIHNGSGFVSLHKVGQMGNGFYQQSEGVLLKSSNIMRETDPDKIVWETLPAGDKGLSAPNAGGLVAEEQSYVVLSDGSFYVNYRTVDGYPVESYSRDGGYTWSAPQYKRFADGGRMKHPRAANFVWKCRNGKYLYWFHNHGGHFIQEMTDIPDGCNTQNDYKGNPYDDRNPAWLCGGIEVDSPEGKLIKWSQPEIVLYDDDPVVRISYPDLIEENGRYYLTETQKLIARRHEIPADFLDKIWTGIEAYEGFSTPIDNAGRSADLVLNIKNARMIDAPRLPAFLSQDKDSVDMRGKESRRGFAIELIIHSSGACSIIDGTRDDGRGLLLKVLSDGRLELTMNDGWTEQVIRSEPCIISNEKQHIVINVDGGPKIISFIVDGHFCDGGEHQQFGWSRFSRQFRHINWSSTWNLGDENCQVEEILVHKRVLMTAEACINCNCMHEEGIPL